MENPSGDNAGERERSHSIGRLRTVSVSLSEQHRVQPTAHDVHRKRIIKNTRSISAGASVRNGVQSENAQGSRFRAIKIRRYRDLKSIYRTRVTAGSTFYQKHATSRNLEKQYVGDISVVSSDNWNRLSSSRISRHIKATSCGRRLVYRSSRLPQ